MSPRAPFGCSYAEGCGSPSEGTASAFSVTCNGSFEVSCGFYFLTTYRFLLLTLVSLNPPWVVHLSKSSM